MIEEENAIKLYNFLMDSKKPMVDFLDSSLGGEDITQTIRFLDENYKDYIFELSIKVTRRIDNE